MATSDLLAELSKDTFRAAPALSVGVCDAVLKQLDDQSGDVSSLAVRCLPPLLRGASDAASAKVVEALCAKLASAGKDAGALRDVGVVGLKTILSEIARPDAARRVVSVAAPKLAALIASAVRSGDAAKDTGMAGDVSGDCIDILHLASSCHGDAMRPLADAVAGTLLEYVASGGRAGGRKKASACLAALGAATGDDALLDRVADAAMENLTPEAMGVKSDADVAEMSARSADAAAEYVALLGAAARASRGRFAKRAALAFPRLKALLTELRVRGDGGAEGAVPGDARDVRGGVRGGERGGPRRAVGGGDDSRRARVVRVRSQRRRRPDRRRGRLRRGERIARRR